MADDQSPEILLEKINRLEAENRKLIQNEARLQSLLNLSQLSGATEKDIREFALESVVALTESKGGYLHFVNEDNGTINLVSWSKSVLQECSAVKTSHYPIDSAGIWADSIRLRRPVVHNDFQREPDKKGYPEGHFTVIRHLSVPVFDGERIVAVAGVGNKEANYTDADMKQTMLFMNSMWSILKQKKAEEILIKYSMEDSMTGLANRRRFDEVMGIEWKRHMRSEDWLSVIIIDVDYFKRYNDTYGHPEGDACLKKIGDCVKQQFKRSGELVARYGGEEFAVIIPSCSLSNALSRAESLRACVHDMKMAHSSSKISEYVTISAGVASTIPRKGSDHSVLVIWADRELYTAKKEGRNRVLGKDLELNQTAVEG